jgi:hypothetical protein
MDEHDYGIDLSVFTEAAEFFIAVAFPQPEEFQMQHVILNWG